jgi:hypothetical protein
MTWLKLYYRDKDKVMRAIPGIKILPGNILPAAIYLDQSVYTLTMKAGRRWWFDATKLTSSTRRDDE